MSKDTYNYPYSLTRESYSRKWLASPKILPCLTSKDTCTTRLLCSLCQVFDKVSRAAQPSRSDRRPLPPTHITGESRYLAAEQAACSACPAASAVSSISVVIGPERDLARSGGGSSAPASTSPCNH